MISGVSEFSCFAIEHIQKHGNHGKYLISSIFGVLRSFTYLELFLKDFVWSGYNSQSVAQSYPQNLALNLEISSFSGY